MEQIKLLRERTGAGMVDCKKALDEANGDIEKAIEILRKKGIAKAAKRGERETSEGLILVDKNEDGSEGYIVEFNSETDFVARSEKFQEFTKNIFNIIKKEKPKDLETLLALSFENSNVKDSLDNLSGVIGEKLSIKRFDIIISQGTVASYSHAGGRIGVLIELDQKNLADLAFDIAMHTAASNPSYLESSQVPQDLIEKEKEVYAEQLKKEGKTGDIVEKIMIGKVNKFCEEICLLKQAFIKDDKKKIEEILKGAKILKFIRYSL